MRIDPGVETKPSLRETHISFSDAAKLLGCSRQNISQIVKRHPNLLGRDGKWVGILESWVLETLEMRSRS